MQKTKIEWATHTFNPVVGCKNGCSYCYAKRMNDRFKWIKKWDKPTLFLDRLKEKMPKKPSKIFVGSMCDLFGDWIPSNWIWKVIIIAKKNPQHTFQFLTKNPKRYWDFQFPQNCWLGTTLEYSLYEKRLSDLRIFNNDNYKFVSVEPLLSDMANVDFSGIDLVIVGAQTGRGAVVPKKEWIDSIKHHNIFYKDNIKKYLI